MTYTQKEIYTSIGNFLKSSGCHTTRESTSWFSMSSNPSRLAPLIQRLRAWRTANNLSQSEAVALFANVGLPIALSTLQQWEIGRRSPHSVTAAALERFLTEQEKLAATRGHKSVAPVIQRLKAWREANNLSQAQAVEIFLSAGLPAKVKTLQAWETGRNSPQPITAAALEKFLDQHPRITHQPPP